MTNVPTAKPETGTGTERSATGSGWQKAGDVAAVPERSSATEPTPVAPKETYDPRKHVRELRGRGGPSEYLDVKHRIVWFGREHPDGQIITEALDVTPEFAFFKATVSFIHTAPGDNLSTLVACTGHGSETKSDFGDYVEKAETKAIGRALQHARYGTASMPEDDALADAPVAQNKGSVRYESPRGVPSATSALSNAHGAAERAAELSDARTRRAAMDLEITAHTKRTGATPEDVQEFCEEMFGTRDARKLNNAQMVELLKEFRRIPNDRFSELRKDTNTVE